MKKVKAKTKRKQNKGKTLKKTNVDETSERSLYSSERNFLHVTRTLAGPPKERL